MSSSNFIVVFVNILISLCVFAKVSTAELTPFQLTFHNQAWKAVPEVNDRNLGQYFLIPIEMLEAEVRIIKGDTNTVLEVLFGESKCTRKDFKSSQITSSKCPLIKDGKRALYNLELWENSGEIVVKKIRDVKKDEVFVINLIK